MSYPSDDFYIGADITGLLMSKPGIDPSRQHERDALRRIFQERNLQTEKWGDQSDHTDLLWLAILTEELGEVAKALQTPNSDGQYTATYSMYVELTQCAAVCLAWMEAIQYRKVVS